MKCAFWASLAAAVLALVLSGCGAASDAGESAGSMEVVTGLVRSVEAESLLALKSITVEDETGKLWTFEARGRAFSGFTPSHVREHMFLALPVTVQFYRDGDTLIMDGITD